MYPKACWHHVSHAAPINLDVFEEGYTALSKAEDRLKFTGGKCAGLIEKKKGTYEVAFDDGETWDLWQMHVHGPRRTR